MQTTKNNSKYIGKDLDAMSNAPNYYSWILDTFKPYLGSKILEVGAGSGTFTKYLLSTKPKKYFGIDPSKDVFRRLQENIKGENITLLNGFLEETKPKIPQDLDSIVYINVLEHVQYDTKELEIVNSLLKKGGYVCIYVPALNWLMGSFDRKVGHYRRYTKKSLRKVLLEAGFEVENIYYSDPIGIPIWWFLFVLLKLEDLGGGETATYDRFIIPVLRFFESIVRPPIGKNLVAIGRKK